jgi:uncharacterized OsmC-like protein
MSTSTLVYAGNLSTQATHTRSGSKIITDAPVDNNGKGLNFSPTDLLATSLASCMLTIMGIAANKHQINMGFPEAEVIKLMDSAPRRVKEIQILIRFPQSTLDKKSKTILEKAALTCPVALSIHPDIKQNVSFKYE